MTTTICTFTFEPADGTAATDWSAPVALLRQSGLPEEGNLQLMRRVAQSARIAQPTGGLDGGALNRQLEQMIVR